MIKRRSISKRLRFFILERDGFRCRYCGAMAADAKLHIDHRTPVSAGGGNEDSNLVTACEDCNLGKAAQLPRPLFKKQWEFALAALIFGRALERFGRVVSADDYWMIENFCLAELEPQDFARELDRADSWPTAKARFYEIAGYPPSDGEVFH